MSEKKRKIILNDWWKQFLTGVMGTAIGVGLTFAVSNWVENDKKAQVQRQTAMMAVYDIDEIIREIKEDLQREDALYGINLYLSNHPDKIDNVSGDSIRQAIIYLVEEPTSLPDWSTDAKEKAFTSSMDAWQNLENSQFYDNVQKCYQRRAELLRIIQKDATFRQPVKDAFLDQFIEQASADDLDFDGSLTYDALRKILKQTYPKPETIRFLRMYPLRCKVYNGYIDDLSRLNQENKFLMGITDEEMASYIRKNIQKTKPATPKLLAGVWGLQLNEEGQTFLFRADHTVDITIDIVDKAVIRDEGQDIQVKVPVSYRLYGEWTLEGDSLHIVCPTGKSELVSIDLDMDALTESAKEKAKEWEEAYRRSLNESLLSSYVDQQNTVSFDITGNLMFWTFQYFTTMGQPETLRQQLVRKQEMPQ